MSESKGVVVGVDIGGANTKFANTRGDSVNLPFPLWKSPDSLHTALQRGLNFGAFEGFPALAITMTGELADCYATRSEGVRRILGQVDILRLDAPVWVYCVGNRWHNRQSLTLDALPTNDALAMAASNWHALATWCGDYCAKAGVPIDILVDIGSTTVDVIPIAHREVASGASTDRERLQLKQLVYTGIERTPIPSIVDSVSIDGKPCPIMAERFADSLDAYLSLSLVAERPENCDTADGRPRTRAHANARLARLVGEDANTLSCELIEDIARQVIERQVAKVLAAINSNMPSGAVADPMVKPMADQVIPTILFTGHGHSLASMIEERMPHAKFRYLAEFINADASRCAPAFAVAHLLEKRLENSKTAVLAV